MVCKWVVKTMCKHTIIKIEDVTLCTKCGMTTFSDGKIIFDKDILKYINKPENNRRKNKK